MQTFGRELEGPVKKPDVNLWQFILNESGSGRELRHYGGQVVPTLDLGEKNDLAAGLAYESFERPSAVAGLYFDDDLDIDSGYVISCVDPETGDLIGVFRIRTVLVEWKDKSLERWPITVNLFYYDSSGTSEQVGRI